MARPRRKGLDYYPRDIDFYSDEKIFALMDQYGPLGSTVYECILDLVYRSGYYLEISIEQLSNMITRIIGNRWISGREQMTDIIAYCGRLGLLHEDLLWQGIVTSKGIQRRYDEVTSRRKNSQREYWLLSDEEDNEAQTGVSAAETHVPAPETPICDNGWYINKTTEKKNKVNESIPDKTESCPQADVRNRLCPEARAEFELWIKPISDGDLLRLDGLCRKYGEVQVILAIRAAAGRKAKSLKYVQTVLEGCYPEQDNKTPEAPENSETKEESTPSSAQSTEDFLREFGEVTTVVRGGELCNVYTLEQYRMIEELMDEDDYDYSCAGSSQSPDSD